MFEPIWFLTGLALPALIAGAIVIVVGLISQSPWLRQAAISTAIALGFIAGYIATYGLPPFPPVESQQWLVVAALPATLVISVLAAIAFIPTWAAWLLRLLVAFGITPLLLQSYLKYTWSRGESMTWIISLGIAASIGWCLIIFLTRPRQSDNDTPPTRIDWRLWTFAFVAGGTGVTTMLSGSQTLAQLGLSLAATLAGIAVLQTINPTTANRDFRGFPVDVPFVALVGLWLAGHFYAEITATHAVVLALSPLAAGIGDLPPLHRLSLGKNLAARLVTILTIVGIVVAHAAIKFSQESATDYYG